NIYAARRQESFCHAAADDEVIDFLDHLPQNVELAGNLCTAYNRDYRMFRIAQSLVQRAKLPLHRTSSIGREIVSQTRSCHMRAVSSGKGVINVKIAISRYGFSQVGIISFFTRRKPAVLDHRDAAIRQ